MSEEQNYLECNHCGGPAIYADAHGLFTDGTVERCITCQMPGSVSCDSETEAYWNADENDGDRCIEADCPSCHPNITIPRDLHDLYKEAAEEWAKDWRRPTQLLRTVRCKSCLSATRIDELSTYHSAMVVHAADCRAALLAHCLFWLSKC